MRWNDLQPKNLTIDNHKIIEVSIDETSLLENKIIKYAKENENRYDSRSTKGENRTSEQKIERIKFSKVGEVLWFLYLKEEAVRHSSLFQFKYNVMKEKSYKSQIDILAYISTHPIECEKTIEVRASEIKHFSDITKVLDNFDNIGPYVKIIANNCQYPEVPKDYYVRIWYKTPNFYYLTGGTTKEQILKYGIVKDKLMEKGRECLTLSIRECPDVEKIMKIILDV